MIFTDFFWSRGTGGLTIFAAVAMLLCPAIGAAQTSVLTTTAESHAVAITIDSENLIELYQSVPDLRIVDSRHREDHVLGHIELSSNLPMAETSCESLARLATDKDTAMVFYSNGIDGDASIQALNIASACGYKRLFWLRGGFIEWQDKDYPYVMG